MHRAYVPVILIFYLTWQCESCPPCYAMQLYCCNGQEVSTRPICNREHVLLSSTWTLLSPVVGCKANPRLIVWWVAICSVVQGFYEYFSVLHSFSSWMPTLPLGLQHWRGWPSIFENWKTRQEPHSPTSLVVSLTLDLTRIVLQANVNMVKDGT